MINLNVTENYFEYIKRNPMDKVIVYGAGNMARKNYQYMGHIDFFCDKEAKSIGSVENISCLLPEELEGLSGRLTILICIRDRKIFDEVYEMLMKLSIEGEVFDFFKNPAFYYVDDLAYRYCENSKDKLKINIVYHNDGWILGKFAQKLQEELEKLGQEVSISDEEDEKADINHYVFYNDLRNFFDKNDHVRTVMITHIDSMLKRDLLDFQTKNGVVGICMSSDTLNKLVSWGISRDRICYINPAQDGEIEPKKIVLGITNRCYHQTDFRKNDNVILEVFKQLDPRYFMLKIMGSGWDEIIRKIRSMGFEVEHHDEFNREIYIKLMPSLDYWMYYGFDEGAMGFLDALAAGVKTIATPQGYHLDVKCGLTYKCSTIDDFTDVLKKIQEERKEITAAVKDWTWDNYAKKHLEVWQYLTRTRPLRELYVHQSEYMDGIFSLLVSNPSAL